MISKMIHKMDSVIKCIHLIRKTKRVRELETTIIQEIAQREGAQKQYKMKLISNKKEYKVLYKELGEYKKSERERETFFMFDCVRVKERYDDIWGRYLN